MCPRKAPEVKLMELQWLRNFHKYLNIYAPCLSNRAFPKFILSWDTPFLGHTFTSPQNHRWEDHESDYISLEGEKVIVSLKPWNLYQIHIKTYVLVY